MSSFLSLRVLSQNHSLFRSNIIHSFTHRSLSAFPASSSSFTQRNSFKLEKFQTKRMHVSPRNSSESSPSAETSTSNTVLESNSFGGSQISFERKQKPKTVEKDEKLRKLREIMASSDGGKGIDAYIIPSEDPHQSEMIADCYKRREFISGFTGSAGTVVVTNDVALLWTDGRYFLQASQELGPEWVLMKSGEQNVPEIKFWLKDNLNENARVGIDPFLHSTNNVRDLTDTLSPKNISIISLYDNLVDKLWPSKSSEPNFPFRVHPLNYAGVDVSTKIKQIQKILKEKNSNALIITMLDEIAWLFNLRGTDIPNCQVGIAYAIVEEDSSTLFVNNGKVNDDVSDHLSKADVTIKNYSDLIPYVNGLAKEGTKLLLDSSNVNFAIFCAFENACRFFFENLEKTFAEQPELKFEKQKNGPYYAFDTSPIPLMKAKKNDAELQGMKDAHIRDAAALAEFFCFVEKELTEGKIFYSEFEISEILLDFRKKQKKFITNSFDTIAGFGSNGAIIHYRPEMHNSKTITSDSLFLLDSGAQYNDGTTDITRTVHFGCPSPYQKDCFTRVLKGNIAIDTSIFPESIPGFVLDAFARSSLWKAGLDYRHGTGHGVGAALNVHEGPQSISPRFANYATLIPGMIISNEPGYYEDGAFGIRIENLLYVKEMNTPNNFGALTFLGFEKLTFFPIQLKMIDTSILTDEEIKWIDDYHSEVWEKVSPLLDGEAKDWLKRNTVPLV